MVRDGVVILLVAPAEPADRPFCPPNPSGSGTPEASADLGSTTGALTAAFLLVTAAAGTLLGFNWTQAVLLGGVAAIVAAASAWLTARRANAD